MNGVQDGRGDSGGDRLGEEGAGDSLRRRRGSSSGRGGKLDAIADRLHQIRATNEQVRGAHAGGARTPTSDRANKPSNETERQAIAATPTVCAGRSVSVRSDEVADLRNVCEIDLGQCRHWTGAPFHSRLWYELPLEFEPTSSHTEMLDALLPTWHDKVLSFGDTWHIADRVVSDLFFTSSHTTWRKPGLYWEAGNGFFYYAMRYAVATMYAFAYAVNEVSEFTDASGMDKDAVRNKLSALVHLVVKPGRFSNYTLDQITVTDGYVTARRTWRPSPDFPYEHYVAYTFSDVTHVNDGMQLTAAIADYYYFWWAHRLYDWAESGNAGGEADAVRFLAKMCARAALAEIVDIAGLFIHEVTHLGHFVDSLYECQANSMFGLQYLKCASYMNSWIFRARVTSDLALPVPLFANCDDGSSEDAKDKPADSAGDPRDRFDFRADESWYFQYATNVTACAPSSLEIAHLDLWAEAHTAVGIWRYPGVCDSPNALASVSGVAIMN